MGRRLRVLIAEDNEDDAVFVLRELRRAGFDPVHERVESAAAMRAALDRSQWDFILSDYHMPAFSATDAFAIVTEEGLDVPFVIISGTVGEDVAVEAMRLGVQDYLLKGNLTRLGQVVERELREKKMRDERASAQEELRRSEQRYRALFEGSPLPTWVCDRKTEAFLAVNQAALEHYGYEREEFGRLTAAALRVSAPAGETTAKDVEERHKKKDGSEISVEVTSHDFEFAGRPVRFTVVHDISERKRAEASLRQTEEQLRQAQKMEAVGRLAGGVSHDFNNLLSVILTYADLLLESTPPGDPNRADLAEIQKAGQKARDLTRQLLAYSRQQVLDPRTLDLNQIAADLERMLKRLVGEDVELSVMTGASLGKVNADPSQIEQVIMNLVVNARDAMPRGGQIVIETSNAELDASSAAEIVGMKPGRYVVLSVSDTGSGMDAATKARIFEPFFTTKEIGKGTGLGLSTVFGIVDQSGGHIGVDSEPGKGTTFRIFLPRGDSEGVVIAAKGPSLASLRGTETVLLVDDDDQVRTAMRRSLRRHGYKVVEAQNAGEAFLIAERDNSPIDLLLTDVIMPRMGGPALAERLLPLRPNLKVLFVSGYADTSQHGQLSGNPKVAFLQKPVTPDVLARKVREVLDGSAIPGRNGG